MVKPEDLGWPPPPKNSASCEMSILGWLLRRLTLTDPLFSSRSSIRPFIPYKLLKNPAMPSSSSLVISLLIMSSKVNMEKARLYFLLIARLLIAAPQIFIASRLLLRQVCLII